MRELRFVKGAISMDTLPKSTDAISIPEVAFVGRSNVGKSSLINMVTNRKKLAFVSTAIKLLSFLQLKCVEYLISVVFQRCCDNHFIFQVSNTPGKTSEYNYFLAEGIIGIKQEDHKFYLVDLPGVGYAEVMRKKRMDWMEFLQEYTSKHEPLKAVFHLVDSRHGLLGADQECLSILSTLPSHVQVMFGQRIEGSFVFFAY